MDSEKIKQTVVDILKTSDLDKITEKHVRSLTSDKLNINLSDLPHKIFVRQIIESFLLDPPNAPLFQCNNNNIDDNNTHHNDANLPTINGEAVTDDVETKPVVSSRIICKLSQKRDVAVRSTEGKTVVSIREHLWKDGKQTSTPRCISLSDEKWSIFRKSIPAIEEAISKVESRLRSKFEEKQADDDRNKSNKQTGGRHSIAEPMQNNGLHGLVAATKQVEGASTVPSTPQALVPIEIIRFDGNNYQQWAHRMESYLGHLKVAYVLSDPCPNAVGHTIGELTQTLSAVQKWVDDDHVCCQNIINSLCDNLYSHYSKRTGTSKDLWEELKLVYLYKEYGSKVSLVKKYIEFEIVEEKSVFEQVRELHHIADSLIASGMYVEEKFHVNVIISKLPQSWKPFSIDLIKEDSLPVWMLMNNLKAEEESRQKGNKSEAPLPRPTDSPMFKPNKMLAPHRIPMKKPGLPMTNHMVDREKMVKYCTICKKKGHLPEQCWFRNPISKDIANGKDGITTAGVVAEGVKDGSAGQSKC